MGRTIRTIIAVDFDGTLCENKYPQIGEPLQEVLDKIIKFQQEGMFIILWTCREGQDLENAVKWCKERGFIPDAVNDDAPWIKKEFEQEVEVRKAVNEKGRTGAKIFANWYIDDRAINVSDF